MKRSGLIISLALAFAPLAAAQTVTVTIKGVQGSEGNILANLCGESTAPFPGPCLTHVAMGKAEAGETTLAFDHVIDGQYALQVFHDADGDMSPGIPSEGYAFGNDAAWPIDFNKAAFAVRGDTSVAVTLIYGLSIRRSTPKE